MNSTTRYRTVQPQRGIGFVEILIAVFVISLAVLGLGRMISTSSETAANSKARSEALNVAELELEQLRDYADDDEYDTTIVDSSLGTVTGSNASFTRTLDVTPSTVTDPSTDPDYRDVTITVAWIGTEGGEDAVITTRIAEERPVEAGAKLVSLANGGQPGFDTVYDPDNMPVDPPPEDPPPADDGCVGDTCTTTGDLSGDVLVEGDPPTTGINVYGQIDTSRANDRIITVQAFGNFVTVVCTPGYGSGSIEGYWCPIGPTTSGQSTIWSVSISVTVTDNQGYCPTSNIYTLGDLQGGTNYYFPLVGYLTVPEPVCP